MHRLIFPLLFSSCLMSFAQDHVIEGKVIDAATKQPIAFVAIGFVGHDVGTVSTAEGLFRLTIPSKFLNDSLTFSEVVHKRKKVLVAELLNAKEIVVSLEESVMELRTVEITPEREKRRYENLGVNPMFYWGSCYANFKGGAQIAQLMEARAYPAFLVSAKIKIGENTLTNAKLRLRILTKTENGLPGSDVFEGVYKDISSQKGWIAFDLRDANLKFDEDFFICFEFLNVEWQQTSGYFSIVCSEIDDFPEKQFVRTASLGPWQRALPAQKHIYAIGAEVYRIK